MVKKKYNSKWGKLKVSKKERRLIYQRLRGNANVILKNLHKWEYKQIMKDLILEEYIYISKKREGGLK